MLENLDATRWETFPQPEENAADSVPDALRRLASCHGATDCDDAYNRFLYAVGNNHAGTYYPVVSPTIPFLGEILNRGHEEAQVAALNVLYDLSVSFYPEAGYEIVTTSGGDQQKTATLLLLAALSLTKTISLIAADSTKQEPTRQLAADFLQDLLTKGDSI